MVSLDTGDIGLELSEVGPNELIARFPKLVEFEDTFRNPDKNESFRSKVPAVLKKYVSTFSIKKSILQTFPIIETLRTYKLREYLLSDIIAGLTSGIMMIPQGMAFAALSTLPPIVGLYISFFASITYIFLGTGRQQSWGCIAILSLMIATILDKYDASVSPGTALLCSNGTVINSLYGRAPNFNKSKNSEHSTDATTDAPSMTTSELLISTSSVTTHHEDTQAAVTAKRMEVASGLTVIAGFVLIIASRVGLSKITSLMSNSLITGFTVGISFHVATSQLKNILGLSIPRLSGIASIVRTWIEILKNIPETNVASLIMSIISILAIYLVKKFINEKYKKQLRIPIPIELFVVIIATVASTFAHFNEEYNVSIVGDVPVGVPAPKFPNLYLVKDYIGDALIIIVVAYAQTLAMAKTMGLKHNYAVDANQEMLACGACSLVCGLFSGYITGASVSRSVVQDGAGGKTQIASLFAAALVLLVILLIGPYFYDLPMCVLSSIILVNLRTMFLKLLLIPSEWRKSHYDCAVWVFTCVATIILNPDIGLLAGVMFGLFLVVFRAMNTPIVEAGQIPTSAFTVQLRAVQNYSSAKKLQSVKIIKIKTPLYFVNADIFTSNVLSKTGVNPIKLRKKMEVIEAEVVANEKSESNGKLLSIVNRGGVSGIKVIIFDAAGMSFIDVMGVQALQFLVSEFTSVGVEILITSVPENVIPMLKSTDFLKKNADRIFLTLEAALATIVTAADNIDGVTKRLSRS